MKAFIKKLSMLLAIGAVAFGSGMMNDDAKVASAANTTDELTAAVLGLGGSYADVSGVIVNSTTYAANGMKNGSGSIQIRSKSNSGIISTSSNGKIYSVNVVWDSSTANGRTLDIYGSNIAYTATSDLYATSTQGTKLGSIVKGTSTSFTVAATDDYSYIGLRSNSSAMYLTSISIEWAADDSSATPQEKADVFIAKIADFEAKELTINDKTDIDFLREEYAALESDVKTIVDAANADARITALENKIIAIQNKIDVDAANAVKTAIASIGEITDLSKETLVSSVRSDYDSLTETQKALVDNLDVLETAEAKIAELKANFVTAEFVFGSSSDITGSLLSTEGYTINNIKLAATKANEENGWRSNKEALRVYGSAELTISLTSEDLSIYKVDIEHNGTYTVADKFEFTALPSETTVTLGNGSLFLPEGTTSVVMFNANASQARINSIVVECVKAEKVDNLQVLIDLINSLDTCTDYDQAATLREMYNALSEEEKAIFDATEVGGYTLAHKLAYMEQLAANETASSNANNNLFTSLNNSSNTSFVLIIGVMGLMAIAAYYFLNKKKVSC